MKFSVGFIESPVMSIYVVLTPLGPSLSRGEIGRVATMELLTDSYNVN